MKFLCDENVDQQVVDELRRTGHEVNYVAELSPGIDDDQILDAANRQGATLVTSDRDFGELVFRQRRISGGVLLVRLGGLSPEKRAQIVAATVRDHGTEMVGGSRAALGAPCGLRDTRGGVSSRGDHVVE